MNAEIGLLIERIEIEAFKSISNEALGLAPLTVVTGQNSAGKSSLLQAVRLSAHLASLRSRDGKVQLNVPELRLGDFADVLHLGAGSEIRIALDLGDSNGARRWGFSLGPRSNRVGAQLESIELSGRSAHLQLSRRPREADLRDLEVLADRTNTFGGANDVLHRLALHAASISSSRHVRESAHFEGSVGEHRPVTLAEVAGGLPAVLLEARSYSRRLAKIYVEENKDGTIGQQSFLPGEWSFDFEDDLPYFLAEHLGDLGNFEVEEDDVRPFASGLVPYGEEPEWWRDQERRVELAIDRLVERGKIPLMEVLDELVSDELEVASDFIRSLPSRIHYLGPLRSEPSASEAAGHSTAGLAMLGLRGELAVPYLFEYQDQPVLCPMPDSGGAETMPLLRAVSEWLRALGIAERHQVDPISQSIEYRLIDPQTKEKRDLTAVGVGASQILPVLVLCLAAQPGELVLLEQPELHLHPKPQQIIGDFFLGIARSGRQLMVETHSEYLINRLRLRLAQDPEPISVLTKILYAERTGGATDFKELQPNDFGGFDEWPDGFFDQLPAEAEKIVRAAAARRRERARSENS